MLEKAINKIKSEMDKDKNNPYIQYIGNFLLNEIKDNASAAECILAADKSIAKSLDVMAQEARKKPRVGSCVMLTPDEGFKVVLKYFGIESKSSYTDYQDLKQTVTTPNSAKQCDAVEFDVKLDDFLI